MFLKTNHSHFNGIEYCDSVKAPVVSEMQTMVFWCQCPDPTAETIISAENEHYKSHFECLFMHKQRGRRTHGFSENLGTLWVGSMIRTHVKLWGYLV